MTNKFYMLFVFLLCIQNYVECKRKIGTGRKGSRVPRSPPLCYTQYQDGKVANEMEMLSPDAENDADQLFKSKYSDDLIIMDYTGPTTSIVDNNLEMTQATPDRFLKDNVIQATPCYNMFQDYLYQSKNSDDLIVLDQVRSSSGSADTSTEQQYSSSKNNTSELTVSLIEMYFKLFVLFVTLCIIFIYLKVKL